MATIGVFLLPSSHSPSHSRSLSLSALLLICLHECLSHLEMRLKSFPKIKTQRTEVALCLCLCLALWIESERNGLAWPGLDWTVVRFAEENSINLAKKEKENKKTRNKETKTEKRK